jgi:hypothetical protein
MVFMSVIFTFLVSAAANLPKGLKKADADNAAMEAINFLRLF